MQKEHWTVISLERRETVAVLTLNNPPLNVLTDELLNQLDEAINDIDRDPGIRAIVLRAAGEKAFAAGADIRQFPSLTKESGIALVEKGKKIFDKLAGGKPVICAVHGLALGAGLELVLACDIRIAEETTKLGLPETGLGILPGYGGTQRLTRLAGPGKAKELILSGEPLSGKAAFEAGLVERLVPQGEAFENAIKLAQSIASKAPLAIANAKKAIDGGVELSLAAGQELETQMFSELAETQDMQEGVKAFTEKRTANFQGK
ncbi:enoyl-CoA hydratase/carnithine racemase [Planomicrobium stackebrandtii]|uniref:Enoyl-CoA hydratase/carnithine racemase n=1 Tax=Planomicrobium stackebrandtii TaxID=253160 RepID=A0ABU0GU70_9BACL|nr:enoyl-CoA hydratase-related protein [Planomicrobium stackebrandtii]MDQ0428107.1 enoyl-CoA hydratase/carnithine racemase [Planomicrobium stackebrandtii]